MVVRNRQLRRPRPPARATEALQEGRHVRGVDLDHPVEVAHVDAQLQGAGGHDHAIAGLGERLLAAAVPRADSERVRDEGRDAPARSALPVLGLGAGVAEHQPLLARGAARR